jgi:hypothetical protein
MTSASCLIFFYLGLLIPFCPFSSFKTPWIFKSSSLAHSSIWLSKLPKLDTPVWQTGQSNFSSLAKFGHQLEVTSEHGERNGGVVPHVKSLRPPPLHRSGHEDVEIRIDVMPGLDMDKHAP